MNGKPVIIKGVNRHEHDENTAKYVPIETMVRDIRLMKQFNVNALRTSHYPNDPAWCDLTDRYDLSPCWSDNDGDCLGSPGQRR